MNANNKPVILLAAAGSCWIASAQRFRGWRMAFPAS